MTYFISMRNFFSLKIEGMKKNLSNTVEVKRRIMCTTYEKFSFIFCNISFQQCKFFSLFFIHVLYLMAKNLLQHRYFSLEVFLTNFWYYNIIMWMLTWVLSKRMKYIYKCLVLNEWMCTQAGGLEFYVFQISFIVTIFLLLYFFLG